MRDQKTLLTLAAEQVEDGRYLDGDFILRHNLLADETIGVWQTIGIIIRGYLASAPDEQNAITFRGLAHNSGLSADAIDLAIAQARLPGATKKAIEALDAIGKRSGKGKRT